MAKSQLFRPPLLDFILTHGGTFPVRRGQRDEEAFITAHSILDRGGTVLMYAEGGRLRTKQLGKPKPGLGRLVLESGVPVVPIAIHGSQNVREAKRGRISPKVTVQYGEPIAFEQVDHPTREQSQEVADEVFARVKEMYEALDAKGRRGVLAARRAAPGPQLLDSGGAERARSRMLATSRPCGDGWREPAAERPNEGIHAGKVGARRLRAAAACAAPAANAEMVGRYHVCGKLNAAPVQGAAELQGMGCSRARPLLRAWLGRSTSLSGEGMPRSTRAHHWQCRRVIAWACTVNGHKVRIVFDLDLRRHGDLAASMKAAFATGPAGQAYVDYGVTVRNLGSDVVSGRLVETLPANAGFVGAVPAQGSCGTPDAAGRLRCSLGGGPDRLRQRRQGHDQGRLRLRELRPRRVRARSPSRVRQGTSIRRTTLRPWTSWIPTARIRSSTSRRIPRTLRSTSPIPTHRRWTRLRRPRIRLRRPRTRLRPRVRGPAGSGARASRRSSGRRWCRRSRRGRPRPGTPPSPPTRGVRAVSPCPRTACPSP